MTSYRSYIYTICLRSRIKTIANNLKLSIIKDKKKLVLAVTALNAIDSPGPGIAVIRAVRECIEFDIRIIGLSYESLEPGIFMHELVDKTYQLPYPSSGTDALHERLSLINDIEHIDVLIPNFDAELYNFIRIEPQLKKMGIRTFLPTPEEFEARDKVNLHKFGTRHNFHVPDDKVIFQVSELIHAAGKFSFPLVVKGKYYDAFICNTLHDAEKAFTGFRQNGVPQ
jgi:carbamoyl-phosphate synthase large subunit